MKRTLKLFLSIITLYIYGLTILFPCHSVAFSNSLGIPEPKSPEFKLAPSSPLAVTANTRIDPSGPVKIIGKPLGLSVLQYLWKREKAWSRKAKNIPIEYYTKYTDIKWGLTQQIENVPIKILVDKNLNPAVESWSFWETDEDGTEIRDTDGEHIGSEDRDRKILVIVVRNIPTNQMRDEIMYHEYVKTVKRDTFTGHSWFHLDDNLKADYERKANITTWAKHIKIFKDPLTGICPSHKIQLDNMKDAPEKLQALLDEYNSTERQEFHAKLIHNVFSNEKTDVRLRIVKLLQEYENSICNYIRKLLVKESRKALFNRLSLPAERSIIGAFLDELELIFDQNKDLEPSSNIPVLIGNTELLYEFFDEIRSEIPVPAEIIISKSRDLPYAIKLFYDNKEYLIDLISLARLEHKMGWWPSMRLIHMRLRSRIKKRVACKLARVKRWKIGRLPRLHNIHPPNNKGTTKLIDSALALLKEGSTVLDLGSGSGVVGIAIAKNRDANVVCSDINPIAVTNSKISVSAEGLTDKVEVLRSNLFNNDSLLGRRFDMIVFNAQRALPKGEATVADTDVLIRNLFYQFADHLTQEGILLLRIPSERDDIKDQVEEFERRGFLKSHKFKLPEMKHHDNSSIYAISVPRERPLDPAIGPLKMLGHKIDEKTVHWLRKVQLKQDGWRQTAGRKDNKAHKLPFKFEFDIPGMPDECKDWLEEELYVKNIGVENLPDGLSASYFWETERIPGTTKREKTLVIVTKPSLIEMEKGTQGLGGIKNMGKNIYNEVIHYGYLHSKWTQKLTADSGKEFRDLTDFEKEKIRQDAHILAAGQTTLAFRQEINKGLSYKGDPEYDISRLHRKQLDNMSIEQLQAVITKFSQEDKYASALRRKMLKPYTNDEIDSNKIIYPDEEIIKYEKMVSAYAIRRVLNLWLEEKQETNKYFIEAKSNKGNIAECYFDWGGTLDPLKPHEMYYLFQMIKDIFGEDFKINILSTTDPRALCADLKKYGLLRYIDTIIHSGLEGMQLTIDTEQNLDEQERTEREVSYFEHVKIVPYPHNQKITYLSEHVIRKRIAEGTMTEDDRILFFDDGARYFGGSKETIQIGILKRGSTTIKSLISDKDAALKDRTRPAHYYMYSLHDVDTFRQLIESIQPKRPKGAANTEPDDSTRALSAAV